MYYFNLCHIQLIMTRIIKFCLNIYVYIYQVSKVTTMYGMFGFNQWRNQARFNHNIQYWDVSSVTDMTLMFANAKYFNQPIGLISQFCMLE